MLFISLTAVLFINTFKKKLFKNWQFGHITSAQLEQEVKEEEEEEEEEEEAEEAEEEEEEEQSIGACPPVVTTCNYHKK